MMQGSRVITRRKMIALGGGAILGVLAAACSQAPAPTAAPSNQAPPATQPPQATQATQPTQPPAAATTVSAAKPAPSGSPTTVKFTAVLDAGMDVVMDAQLAQFAKETPDVKMDFQALPWDGYPEKLLTEVAGGGAPDLSFVHPSWVTLFAERNVLAAQDPFIQGDAGFQGDDFFENVVGYFVYKGKRYCLPSSSWPSVTYFNKTLFEKLGVPLPTEFMAGFENGSDSWTWDKALELAQKLTQGQGATKTFGISPGYGSVPTSLSHLSQIIYSYGGSVWNDDLTRTRLTEPAAIQAIKFQAELVTKHHVAPLPSEAEGIPQGVNGGQYGMWTWNRSEVPGFAKIKFEIGMAPYPRGTQARVLRDGPTGMGILASSKVQEQTWDFLKWFVGPKPGVAGGQEFYYAAHYSIPTRKSLSGDSHFAQNLLPWENQKVYADASTRVKVLPLVARFAEIDKVYGEEWDKIILGRATVEDAMKEFASKADPMMTS